MQDPAREFLRHTLATLAYRGGKALRGAPASFAAFRAGEASGTPLEILAHMGDLFDWAVSLASDYFKADIQAGRVGSEQAAPRVEFD